MYKIDSHAYSPLDRIDFSFILLPNLEHHNLLILLRNALSQHLEQIEASSQPELNSQDSFHNIPVTLPHVSIGHYALLAEELNTLKNILENRSQEFSKFSEEMRTTLHISHYNVSIEAVNIRERTNKNIIKLYKTLRADFLNLIMTKQPTLRAYYHKIIYQDNPAELELINKFYQNWNTPEENRIRPHFTLIYNHKGKDLIESNLHTIPVPKELNFISFDHLGIVSIDSKGNPLKNGLICVTPLS